jgi:hypothetical protein
VFAEKELQYSFPEILEHERRSKDLYGCDSICVRMRWVVKTFLVVVSEVEISARHLWYWLAALPNRDARKYRLGGE